MNIRMFLYALVVVVLSAGSLTAQTTHTLLASADVSDFSQAFLLQMENGEMVTAKVTRYAEFEGAKVGIIEVGEERFVARQFPDGKRTVTYLGLESQEDYSCGTESPHIAEGNSLWPFDGPIPDPVAPDTSITADALFFYEQSAADHFGGREMLGAQVQLGLDNANLVFDNVGLPGFQYRPVGLVLYQEDGIAVEVPPTGWWPFNSQAIRAHRNAVGADLVMFIVNDMTHYAGLATMFWNNDPETGYSMIRADTLFELTLTHEFGHNAGLQHNREMSGDHSPGLPEIGLSMYLCFGYDDIRNAGGVMTTSVSGPLCDGGWRRKKLFTGEGLYYEGIPFWADDAKQKQLLQITFPMVANYREEVIHTTGPCLPNDDVLCVDGVANSNDKRFEVRMSYDSEIFNVSGVGRITWASSQGGLFYFFTVTNPEMLIKIINGCSFNNHYWVYMTAGTNVGFTVSIRDTLTNAGIQLVNQDGVAAQPVQNIQALPCN